MSFSNESLSDICAICLEVITSANIVAPCGHHYDEGCILDLFENSMKDESLFPPRCCSQIIPLESVLEYVDLDWLHQFEAKMEEFGALNRVYCANPACGHFLGSQQEHDSFGPSASTAAPMTKACPAVACMTTTCLLCKHEVTGLEHRCSEDAQDAQVLQLGRAAGWARCPGCKTMVERDQGCFHMTCRCQTQFCYLCESRWKTCACPQMPAQRLPEAGGGQRRPLATAPRVFGLRETVRHVGTAPLNLPVSTRFGVPIPSEVRTARMGRSIPPMSTRFGAAHGRTVSNLPVTPPVQPTSTRFGISQRAPNMGTRASLLGPHPPTRTSAARSTTLMPPASPPARPTSTRHKVSLSVPRAMSTPRGNLSGLRASAPRVPLPPRASLAAQHGPAHSMFSSAPTRTVMIPLRSSGGYGPRHVHSTLAPTTTMQSGVGSGGIRTARHIGRSSILPIPVLEPASLAPLRRSRR
ncbi:hypothetical protein CERSUDRAFT_117009 [Gelatoporia subvermispora B]|uniref:RBR-type E3 ubiquitin transferase n=1 Tax=Ceriporiopsis subvermispora (strain B) TaxID=914234 RepID=M2QRM5_CERS8|nr:hypothetical protein CERSUDRAFT_117009 [Gelatoporia subvermispora B]